MARLAETKGDTLAHGKGASNMSFTRIRSPGPLDRPHGLYSRLRYSLRRTSRASSQWPRMHWPWSTMLPDGPCTEKTPPESASFQSSDLGWTAAQYRSRITLMGANYPRSARGTSSQLGARITNVGLHCTKLIGNNFRPLRVKSPEKLQTGMNLVTGPTPRANIKDAIMNTTTQQHLTTITASELIVAM